MIVRRDMMKRLLVLGVLAVCSLRAGVARAVPLSEPELAVLCREDGGENRWRSEVEQAKTRLTQAAPVKGSQAAPTAQPDAVPKKTAPAPAGSERDKPPKPELTPEEPTKATTAGAAKVTTIAASLAANLKPVCTALNARAAVPASSLKAVTDAYAQWAALTDLVEDERNTVFAVNQVRDQLLIGLSRGGSSRGVASSLETSLLQGTEQFLAKRATEELTLFMIEVLEDRLCKRAQENGPFANTCQVLTGADTLPASVAGLSRAARADFRDVSVWLVRLLHARKAAREACTLDIAQAFTKAARDGQPIFDVVSNVRTLQALMAMPGACKDELAILDPLLTAVRLSRTYASFSALRTEGSYDLLASLAMGDLPNGPPPATSEVLRRLDTLSSISTSSRGAKSTGSTLPRAALGALAPLLGSLVSADVADATTQAMAAILRDDYPDALVQLTRIKPVQQSIGAYHPGTLRALGIAAELAAAESSRDVAAVLEQSSLPLGSWRRKNEPRSGLTLTGLVGLHVNREDVKQEYQGRSVSSGTVLGAAAFLGIDFHRGFRVLRLGAFAPILDFGAMTSTRLTTDSDDDYKPDKGAQVGIQQLLSPGLFGYIGAGPLALGAGFSWVPALRQVSETGGANSRELSVFRYGLFLAVDISILPLL